MPCNRNRNIFGSTSKDGSYANATIQPLLIKGLSCRRHIKQNQSQPYPSYNRWFKIRPVLDLFLARCKSVKSEEKQCIDAYSKASSHIKDAVGCGNMRQENY
ncbi:hypothetical protein T4B_13084 [Trichinella pseudospiralis]|uniref:Uncharacterized protein n=2 Tax=Trichinella pseudospiralis TaxID=6337 RepID=A0A0V1IJS0_TRIPS|nr:hypothetical protein T4D_14541 [Trichinella pseudospiralis]KRZ23032.1 hypothetical protein T4B_13084 [Trichinella pseudospiralis]